MRRPLVVELRTPHNLCVLVTAQARSVLVISKSASHVTFIVKNLVTVEDVLPVDGSWVQKPVPPAGRMKGEMCLGCYMFHPQLRRLRLSKCTQTELDSKLCSPNSNAIYIDHKETTNICMILCMLITWQEMITEFPAGEGGLCDTCPARCSYSGETDRITTLSSGPH